MLAAGVKGCVPLGAASVSRTLLSLRAWLSAATDRPAAVVEFQSNCKNGAFPREEMSHDRNESDPP
jgi:hypothetical protein